MPTVSEKLGEWVVATCYDDIPQEVVNAAKRSILDCVGVTIAGSSQPIARIISSYLGEVGGARQSTVIGLGIKSSCIETAFANGFLGHYLDYDDFLITVAGGGGPHISAAVLPTALAAAEKENRSGKELIEAYILGCEVAYRVGRAVDPTHYNLGWHTTGTEGVFGATVAASKLLRLNPEQIVYALGIAGSEASGLRENFGTATKPFHAGQASAKGLKAALLARLGFDSARTIFEGTNGFCNVLSQNPRIDEITGSIGRPFCLPQFMLKPYPCCAASHTGIYAMLELVKLHEIDSVDVEKIEVRCAPTIPGILIYTDPKTALEGKFSIQFPIALAICEKRVTLPEFTDEKIREPEIVALMPKIKLVPDPELNSKSPDDRPEVVEVTLKGGKKLTRRCDYRPGSPRNPLSDNELFEKYRSCARLVLPENKIEQSLRFIMNLEKADKAARLLKLVRRPQPGGKE